MKCLQVFEPGVDGVFRHVEGLTRYLMREGVEVSLAYSSARGSDRLENLLSDVVKNGGRIIDLRVGNGPSFKDLNAIWCLRAFIQSIKPDVIHAHSSKAGALTRIIKGLDEPTPVIYTPNAYFGMGKLVSPKVLLYNTIEMLLGRLGTTINVSNDEADFAKRTLRINRYQSCIIPNGIDPKRFRNPSVKEKETKRKKYSIPESALVVGTVGRVSSQKDYDTLYQALIPVMGENRELQLFHLGSGALKRETITKIKHAGISSRIRRIDYLPDPRDVYELMDVFMITSRYEGLSFAILEALACDLPLIVSNVPGNREFLRQGLSHCWSAPAGDVVKFSKSLRIWLNDLKSMRKRNHRRIIKRRYSLDSCCEKIINYYKSVISDVSPLII